MRDHIHCQLCELPFDRHGGEYIDVMIANGFLPPDNSTLAVHICRACATACATALEESTP